MKLNFLAICMCSVIALSSCTKEAIRNHGTAVQSPSSATISYSEWISGSHITWSDTNTDGYPALHATFHALLSENMVNNNSVLVYARKKDTQHTSVFPATFFSSNDHYEMLYSVNTMDGIQVYYTMNVNGEYEIPVTDNIEFRYILVEQPPVASNGRPDMSGVQQYSMDDLRSMTYEDAMLALGIDK